jgi:hypothetical protein
MSSEPVCDHTKPSLQTYGLRREQASTLRIACFEIEYSAGASDYDMETGVEKFQNIRFRFAISSFA